MNNFDLFKMGIKNLFRRKLRTFLTALGIVIGTVSIVVMVSLGIGMTQQMDSWVKEMGDVTIIEVSPSYEGTGKKNAEGQYIIPKEDLEKIKGISNVLAVTPQIDEYVYMISGKYSGGIQVIGMDMSVAEEFGIKLEKGRMPNEMDRVAFIAGKEVPFNLRDPRKSSGISRSYGYGGRYGGDMEEEERVPDVDIMEDRLYYTMDSSYLYDKNGGGKKIKPEKISCVGMIEGDDWRIAGSAYMDIEVLQKLKETYQKKTGNYKKSRNEGYRNVRVKVTDAKHVKEVQEQIKAMGLEARGMLDMVESIKKQSKTTQMIFGGIGGISLLVAAIGITNTMIMAIYERRKEIGVMKVIGARIKDIKRLFLLESAAIGLLGGAIGLLCSSGISKVINSFAAKSGMGMGGEAIKISIIPFWLAISALGFTALIGLLSGYLPARKAMKLSALEAIKND